MSENSLTTGAMMDNEIELVSDGDGHAALGASVDFVTDYTELMQLLTA